MLFRNDKPSQVQASLAARPVPPAEDDVQEHEGGVQEKQKADRYSVSIIILHFRFYY